MKLSPATLLADAWRIWRTDWEVLAAITGLFVFLPALAVDLLLTPELDTALKKLGPTDTSAQFATMVAWTQGIMPWLVLVQILVQFAMLAVLIFYLDRQRASVGGALARALQWLPLYVLAILVSSALSFLGLAVLIVGYFYVAARLSLAGAVMAAERETNPFAALGRSIALTRGNGLILTAIALLVLAMTWMSQVPFGQIDAWMTGNAPNPVARAIIGLAVAAITTLSIVATALIQVAAYRRLSSS